MLIVIEGLDASGKTTQTKLLVERLEKENVNVHTLDFPQYTTNVFGKIVKRFLSNDFGDSVSLDPKLSALLFAGDRFESKELLNSWLKTPESESNSESIEQESVVVLNRYTPSNIAYNRAKSTNAEAANEIHLFIEMLEYQMLELPKPDIVLVLGSSSAITKARLQNEKANRDESRANSDAYESDSSFLDNVAKEYVHLCNTQDDWILIEITQDESIESVHERLWKCLLAFITTNYHNINKSLNKI
jgi:dTMP kinase